MSERQVSRQMRYLASVVFVAVWVACGYGFHLDANSYLLLGVPLTVFFQVVVKQEPLRALWVRDAPPLGINLKIAAFFVALLIVPVIVLIRTASHPTTAPVMIWQISCLFGAFAAAYALARFDKSSLKALGLTMATGGAAVVTLMGLVALVRPVKLDAQAVQTFGQSFLLYLPVSFVLEEVTFRGAIDSFVQRPDEGQGVQSAFFVSALWGLWHMPIVPHATPFTAIQLVIWQCILGVPLSFGWRKSGNLAVPAIVHAFADAVRNVVTGV